MSIARGRRPDNPGDEPAGFGFSPPSKSTVGFR